MNKIVHKVALVLDPHFGEKLFPIAERMHVWAVNSTKNSAAAKEWWHKNNDIFFQKGISTFEYNSNQTPEEIASRIIETIDDHHVADYDEEFGEIPEWSVIEVYGCSLKSPIKETLQQFDISEFEKTVFGFIGKMVKQ